MNVSAPDGVRVETCGRTDLDDLFRKGGILDYRLTHHPILLFTQPGAGHVKVVLIERAEGALIHSTRTSQHAVARQAITLHVHTHGGIAMQRHEGGAGCDAGAVRGKVMLHTAHGGIPAALGQARWFYARLAGLSVDPPGVGLCNIWLPRTLGPGRQMDERIDCIKVHLPVVEVAPSLPHPESVRPDRASRSCG